jgi:three-Cys-motif partner protein
MKKIDVKKNLLNHSQAKVWLLGEYLKRYLNIISNDGYTRTIDIYDLFCGEGIYENGREGSPIVILREVKELFFANVSKLKTLPKINCHFNDIDSNKVLKTRNFILEKKLYYDKFGDIEYLNVDYEYYIYELNIKLQKLKSEKAFVFIDPYEYKHIKISQIKELLSNKKTEVLLWLPTQFMYRFESNGTPQALKDFIEELVPYKNWKA